MIYKYKDGPIKPINWMDSVKQANDPEALSQLYIQNLKEELKLLESQAKILKSKLGVFQHNKPKLIHTTEKLADPKQASVQLGKSTSDFAKYPTHQKLSNVFADQNAFGSAAVKVEYIRELEQLIEALKKQNHALQLLVDKQPKPRTSTAPRKKYEGYDSNESHIMLAKSSQVMVTRLHKKPYTAVIRPDNTLQDRMIQNLLEEKQILEQEIALYKQSPMTRKLQGKQIKMEGRDFLQKMKINDTSTIVFKAKTKYVTAVKEQQQVEEKYLQALMQETFLLQQQKKINITIQILNKMSDIEETINRIKTHKSVQGIVIVNKEGQIIRSTYGTDKKQEGEAIARNIPSLVAKAISTIKDLDTTNDLTFLRLKSKKNEIMVAPDKEFLLIVVQGPKEEKKEEAD